MELPRPFDALWFILERGGPTTVQLTLMAEALALIVAVISGLALLSKLAIVRGAVRAYVEVFRGSSVLVQLFWAFYVLPFFGISLSPLMAGVLAFGINLGAYKAEVVRGAIQAVPRGQIEAAVALNMSPSLRMRRVIFPQAIRFMIAPLGNFFIQLLKLTALAFFITIPEMTFYSKNFIDLTNRPIDTWLMLLIAYFVVAYPLTLGVRWLERRQSRFYTAGGH